MGEILVLIVGCCGCYICGDLGCVDISWFVRCCGLMGLFGEWQFMLWVYINVLVLIVCEGLGVVFCEVELV